MLTSIRVLLPYNPLNEKIADGLFNQEYLQLKEKSIACSLFDYDSLSGDAFHPRPQLNKGERIIYRGWMLTPRRYKQLAQRVKQQGAEMLTSTEDFIKSHYLPGWYQSVREFTPETIFIENAKHAVAEAEKTGWGKFFVKDFVKSNYSERGSIANSPQEIDEILRLIRAQRGEIEGGISLRKVEALLAGSETRYFIVNGKPYAANGVIPNIVREVAKRHSVPFFSADIAQRADGQLRLVEIGDGQVSDIKGWDTRIFYQMLFENM